MFFTIVSMIDEVGLFRPIVDFALGVEQLEDEVLLFYAVSGLLSMISDNVFVGKHQSMKTNKN